MRRGGAVVWVWRGFSPSRDAIVLHAEKDIVKRYGAFAGGAKCAARMQLVDCGFDFQVKLRP